MLAFQRTTSQNQDFIALVRQLDAELAKIDGSEHNFYAQYNTIDSIKHVIVVYENSVPIACGAIKPFDEKTMEVKRMYTLPAYRGKGIASQVLSELEKWVMELYFTFCLLETGLRQPDAIHLYEKNGYRSIPNYGQYADVENSRCYEKKLI